MKISNPLPMIREYPKTVLLAATVATIFGGRCAVDRLDTATFTPQKAAEVLDTKYSQFEFGAQAKAAMQILDPSIKEKPALETSGPFRLILYNEELDLPTKVCRVQLLTDSLAATSGDLEAAALRLDTRNLSTFDQCNEGQRQDANLLYIPKWIVNLAALYLGAKLLTKMIEAVKEFLTELTNPSARERPRERTSAPVTCDRFEGESHIEDGTGAPVRDSAELLEDALEDPMGFVLGTPEVQPTHDRWGAPAPIPPEDLIVDPPRPTRGNPAIDRVREAQARFRGADAAGEVSRPPVFLGSDRDSDPGPRSDLFDDVQPRGPRNPRGSGGSSD